MSTGRAMASAPGDRLQPTHFCFGSDSDHLHGEPHVRFRQQRTLRAALAWSALCHKPTLRSVIRSPRRCGPWRVGRHIEAERVGGLEVDYQV